MWSSNFAGSALGAPSALALALALTFGLVFGLASCGSKPVTAPATAAPPASAAPPALPVAAPRRPDPPPPPPIAATALVYDQARIVATIDLAEARALGVEAALRKLAPFRTGAITADTLADASWLVVATPTILPNPRSSFVFRAGPSARSVQDAIDSAIAADPQRRVDTRAAGVVAAHAPIDGSPHVVLVRDDGIVAIIPESEVDRVAPRLAGSKIAVDLEGDAGRATVLRPQTMLVEIPESAFAARVRVARAPGTATLHLVAELDCPIEQEAIVGAHAITRAFETSAAWAGRARAVARGSVIVVDADATPAMIDAIFR